MGVSAGISQNSDAPGLDGVVNIFFSWWNKDNRVLILPILSIDSFSCIQLQEVDEGGKFWGTLFMNNILCSSSRKEPAVRLAA